MAKQVPTSVQTTEIVLRNGQTIQVQQADPKEITAFLQAKTVEGESLIRETDPEEATLRMIQQIFTTDTAEETLGMQALHAKEYLDRPFTILDVEFLKSADEYQKQGSLPMFALLDVVDVKKRRKKITCGGKIVVATLYHMQRKGTLSDIRSKFVSKRTEAGYDALNLVAAD